MATATQRFTYAPPLRSEAATRGSLFKRLFAALKQSRELQAQREIARHRHLFADTSIESAVARKDLPF